MSYDQTVIQGAINQQVSVLVNDDKN